ncbi:hypothetical protein MLD38_036387 [Melastoma candidum]|uniref:Uncharacterized protein n=1 Tax=Melastoma candidum TaxID=119954 RepID=A0ACB9LJQ6_9MYRT|nr:hypothetical protein MLD38_036387 [Melastoma candidum]
MVRESAGVGSPPGFWARLGGALSQLDPRKPNAPLRGRRSRGAGAELGVSGDAVVGHWEVGHGLSEHGESRPARC